MKLTLVFFLTASLFVFGLQVVRTPSKPPTLSTKELKHLIATAKSREEHLRIAAFYEEEARKLEEKKTEHTEMGAEYDKNPQRYPSKLSLGQHCRNLAVYYGQAEQQALELAGVHRQIAEQLNAPRN
jgi:hypothetical protein